MDFMIVGTSRSGSTMLRNMIQLHRHAGILNESHWLPRMLEFVGMQAVEPKRLLEVARRTSWDTGRTLFDVNCEYAEDQKLRSPEALENCLKQRLQARPLVSVAEFHDEFTKTLFPSARILADKTPDYGFFMTSIQTIWPHCRFVHVVRDCQPTARSMSRHSGCRLMISAGYDNWCSLSYDSLYKMYQPRDLPLDEFVQSWTRRMARIRDEAGRLREGSYLEIAYESLVSEPAGGLSRIAEFVGLEPAQDWLTEAGKIPRP